MQNANASGYKKFWYEIMTAFLHVSIYRMPDDFTPYHRILFLRSFTVRNVT